MILIIKIGKPLTKNAMPIPSNSCQHNGLLTFKKTASAPGVSNTRAACGPRGRFVRPAMRFGNFQIINSCVIWLLHRCLKVLG